MSRASGWAEMRRQVMKGKTLSLLIAGIIIAVGLIAVTGWLLNTTPWDHPDAADFLPTLYAQQPPATVVAPATPTPPPPVATPGTQALEQQLNDKNWHVQLAAAQQLAERSDLPAPQRMALLRGTLEQVITAPGDDTPVIGSYLPPGILLKIQLTRMIGKLGTADPAALQQTATGQSGEVGEWLLLARAMAGSGDAVPQVRQELQNSEHAGVRMVAANVLGTLKARDAVPELRAALKDSYQVSYTDDLGLDHTIYPVREQAAAALGALGIKVERLDDGEFQVSGQ